jgi:NADPH:quinone reductase-like Zn-dependent oxidoreductase
MRAFAVESVGQAPAIHDLPIPAAEGEILIRVKCAGVNPIDYKLVERLTASSKYPFVLGADFAGVVERVPTGNGDSQVGDRIFGMARTHGAYAEYTAVAPGVSTEPLARIPDGVTDEQTAALPIPAVTAMQSLELLRVTAGQRVVVMGATGGSAVMRCRWREPATHTSSRQCGAMPTRLGASAPKKSTIRWLSR